MSFNPFKKKNPEGEPPVSNAPDGGTDAAAGGVEMGQAAAGDATAGMAGPQESDRTDPLGDMTG